VLLSILLYFLHLSQEGNEIELSEEPKLEITITGASVNKLTGTLTWAGMEFSQYEIDNGISKWTDKPCPPWAIGIEEEWSEDV
jgi:hypothetical protein